VLNKRDSFNYPSRSTEERLLQYKEFIRIYNSLNIGEKINTNGKASTLKFHIIEKVPGFNYLLRLADSQLSKNLNLSNEEQVPPEAEAEVAKKQASVSEEGQVPPEAESKEGEKQASVSEEGQVPPEAEAEVAEKQASVSEEGQVPPEAEAEVNQPESEKTNQDTTVTNVIVEGISRFLRDSEGTDLLRGQSSDSSYNFSNVQDESWNEDSDDDQDDDQGIDNEKKIEAAGKSIYTNVLFQL
jgi:hypothetical protein